MERKPKIAIIGTRGYPVVYSGFETWVKELCNGLKYKYEFHVYTHKGLTDKREKVIDGIYVHYFSAIETKSLSQWSHSFQSTIHALFQNYDLLLYASTANGIFGYLTRVFGKRTAINVDGLDWLRPKWKGLGSKIFYNSAKISTRLFDVIIADAGAISDYYKKEFNSNSVTIAYGAYPEEVKDGTAIEKLQLSKQGYYLVVGRLIPDNHLLEIIKGFKSSSSKKKLVIVGDIPYHDPFVVALKKEADDRVIFTGFVKDPILLKSLYGNAYAYLHGHAWGGTNPSLLKALAYGCSVLAHDNVFNREMLDGDKYGFYFSSNPAEISSIINWADGNEELMSIKRSIARNRILENYTWSKIFQQYDELFIKMLNNRTWKCNKFGS